jgi:DNA-directed RNA polymerase specialized sigma24 family protein
VPRRPVSDVDDFVAVCSARLLRTAYLLTGDADVAERLLQGALAKASYAWHRLETQPEPFVRAVLVRKAVAPRRGRPARRRRAVVVLRYVENLSEEETADLVGCSAGTVRREAARELGDLGVDELRRRLVEAAEEVEQIPVHARLAGVDDLVRGIRRRRRAWTAVAGAGACAAAVAAMVLGPGLVSRSAGPRPVLPPPDPSPVLEAPPSLAGYQPRPVLRLDGVDYQYYRGHESLPGSGRLRVALPASRQPQALAWVSPVALDGQIVLSVDGDVVRRDPAGAFDFGVVLSPARPHVVVVRATRPDVSVRLGLAVYRWPQP